MFIYNANLFYLLKMFNRKLKLVTLSVIILISILSVDSKHKSKRRPIFGGFRSMYYPRSPSMVYSRPSTIISGPSRGVFSPRSSLVSSGIPRYSGSYPGLVGLTPLPRSIIPITWRRLASTYIDSSYLLKNVFSCESVCNSIGDYFQVFSTAGKFIELSCKSKTLPNFCVLKNYCVRTENDCSTFIVSSNKK